MDLSSSQCMCENPEHCSVRFAVRHLSKALPFSNPPTRPPPDPPGQCRSDPLVSIYRGPFVCVCVRFTLCVVFRFMWNHFIYMFFCTWWRKPLYYGYLFIFHASVVGLTLYELFGGIANYVTPNSPFPPFVFPFFVFKMSRYHNFIFNSFYFLSPPIDQRHHHHLCVASPFRKNQTDQIETCTPCSPRHHHHRPLSPHYAAACPKFVLSPHNYHHRHNLLPTAKNVCRCILLQPRPQHARH